MPGQAGISFDDAMGSAQGQTKPVSGGGISFDDAMGGSSTPIQRNFKKGSSAQDIQLQLYGRPSKYQHTIDAIEKGIQGVTTKPVMNWWAEYGRQVDAQIGAVKADVRYLTKDVNTERDTGMFSGPITEAKTLWDALGLLWTPLTSVVTTAVSKPIQSVADPYYRKQIQKDYPNRTPEQVDSSIQAINEAIENVSQMAGALASGARIGETPKAIPATADEVRVPRTPPKAPAPVEDSRPLIDQIKETKDEIARLTKENADQAKIEELEGKLAAHHTDMIFEELATKNPEAANILATKVATVAPEVGKKMKLKVKLKQKASPEEQRIVGKDAAQAKIFAHKSSDRWVDDPWGMPGEAESVLTNGGPVEWAPAAIQRLSKGEKDTFGIYTRQGDKLGEFDTIEEAKARAEKLFPEKQRQVIKGGLAMAGDNPMATGLWENLNKKVQEKFAPLIRGSEELAKKHGEDLHPLNVLLPKTTGKEILGHLVDSLPSDTLSSRTAYQKQLFQRLIKAVGDVSIQFLPELKYTNAQGIRERAHGYYDLEAHRIYLDTTLKPDEVPHILVHELTHAATVKFMETNPDHPLTREMNKLFEVAKERHAQQWARFVTDPHATEPPMTHYGLEHPYEFIAELFSNRGFQRWLAKSESWAKPGEKLGNLWNKFASLVQRMLGIDGKYAPLLHRTMSVGEKIIEAQGKDPSTQLLRDASIGMREASGDIYAALSKEEKDNPSDLGAFERIGAKLPRGANVAVGKLAEYQRQLRATFIPSALGKGAEVAMTAIQEAVAKRAQHSLMIGRDSFKRRKLWNKLSEGDILKWMQGVELGAKFKDPAIQTMTEGYRRWADDIYRQDMRTGFEYDPVDHYVPRMFESGPKIPIEDFLQKKFGSKWRNPGFIKDRGFRMIQDAVDAGYVLKHKNPEDMMIARQFASDTAEMQVNILKDLETYGFAVKAKGDGLPPEGFSVQRRSPTGDLYWLNRDSAQIMKNAFDTTSLWSKKGIIGDTFRWLMNIKNNIIPIRLAGLFHVMHVGLGIDTATAFARLNKELLVGKAINTPKAFADFLRTGMPITSSFWTNPRTGWRLMKAYRGELNPSELTKADLDFLQYANEGGFVPFLDRQWKTNAEHKFMDAIQQHSAKAILHAPGALIATLNKPIFEVWIPALKTASYLNEMETLFRLQPELLNQPLERRMALRRLTQHVDERFGEMALNNQFWPRYVKDLAVLNTLSIGWQKGVIGQFGGGVLDLAKIPFRGSVKEQLRTGKLDKTLYAAGYTTIAMGYVGLLSYALSGQPPSGEDFIWPRAGGNNPDGSPKRLSTPFFTREFGSIYKHVRDEGVAKATKDIVLSKGSGMVGLATEAAVGVNSMGQEIRDPNAPMYKKLEQTLHYMLRDIEPISASSQADTTKQRILNVSGFTPAPQYVTDSPTTAKIKSLFLRYRGGSITPFEKVEYSEDVRDLRRLYNSQDTTKYYAAFNKVMEKYKLTDKQGDRLEDSFDSEVDPVIKMFQALPTKVKTDLLNDMDPKEREIFLDATSEDFQDTYEAPK